MVNKRQTLAGTFSSLGPQGPLVVRFDDTLCTLYRLESFCIVRSDLRKAAEELYGPLVEGKTRVNVELHKPKAPSEILVASSLEPLS